MPLVHSDDKIYIDESRIEWNWKFTILSYLFMGFAILLIFSVFLIPVSLLIFALLALDIWLDYKASKKLIEDYLPIFRKASDETAAHVLPEKAPYDLAGKSPAEIAKIALPSFLGNPIIAEQIYTQENLQNDPFLMTAINKYANGVNPAEVIMHINRNDGNGELGTLITTRGIYARCKFLLKTTTEFIPYDTPIIANYVSNAAVAAFGLNIDKLPGTFGGKAIWYRNIGGLRSEVHPIFVTQCSELLTFFRAMQSYR
jgi:hypothetical protein